MRRNALLLALLVVVLAGTGLTASLALAGEEDVATSLEGTVWVANRGAHTIRAFDAATGNVVSTVPMSPGSQPGDLAFARGRVYVAEEFGAPPAIAIVDAGSGVVLDRIPLAAGSRPHHVHASPNGGLVAFGLYGTDTVGVVDTRTDTLLGPWDTNPNAANARVHAAVFSPKGRTLYAVSDATGEVVALDPRSGEIFWRTNVPGAHELVVTRDGTTAYVSRRTANRICVLDLGVHDTCTDVLTLSLPDTLQLAARDGLLTVGLRAMPAQIAVVDTRSLQYELVPIGPPLDTNTVAGHQWTSPNGHLTFAAFEGGSSPGIAVVDHRAGNQVVGTLPYPGRPHGVDVARADDQDAD